ncbi:hypothetical protein N0V82_008238 [Gnomoniopsis sp. IMI 355080]|nr:hypothetical protein N0V82_008238 [Gnomoniopsis sp. IMI 355080]
MVGDSSGAPNEDRKREDATGEEFSRKRGAEGVLSMAIGLNESNHQSKKPEGRFGVEGELEEQAKPLPLLDEGNDRGLGDGLGDGDGAPIEEQKNDDDSGEIGISRRAVGVG